MAFITNKKQIAKLKEPKKWTYKETGECYPCGELNKRLNEKEECEKCFKSKGPSHE